QFVRHGRPSCAPPHVHDTHASGEVVDDQENAVDVRLPSVAQYPDGMISVDALGRHGTALRVFVERQHGPFETVEPTGTLLRCPTDDPPVQFLEIGFRAPRYLNAVCHACGAACRTPAAPAWCGRPSRPQGRPESLRSLRRGRATPGRSRHPGPPTRHSP